MRVPSDNSDHDGAATASSMLRLISVTPIDIPTSPQIVVGRSPLDMSNGKKSGYISACRAVSRRRTFEKSLMRNVYLSNRILTASRLERRHT